MGFHKRANYFVRWMLFIFFALPSKAQMLDSIQLDTLTPCHSIAEGLKHPDKVIKLELRKNHLKVFPPEILNFKNLQYLDLGKNAIKELPYAINSLVNLQVLILEHNKLQELPFTIGGLQQLKILNANNNDLIILPAELGKLQKLEYLDLWSNELTVFPDELSNLKNLKRFDLRVIMIDDDEQKRIKSMLPTTQIDFSPSCKCKTQ